MGIVKDTVEAIITAIIKFFVRKKTGDAFTDQVEIIYALERLIHDEPYRHLNIERAVIVKAHNDGEDISPLSYKYMSVIYEEFRKPFKPVRDKYKGISVDREYIIMISDMYMKKNIVVKTSGMPKGMLNDIFVSEKVSYSQMFFLKHTKKVFWYIEFSTSNSDETFDSPVHRNELYLAVSKIRKLLKQY